MRRTPCWFGATPSNLRPHPLRKSETVARSIVEERQLLDLIRNVADTLIDTSDLNVHELRARIQARFGQEEQGTRLRVSTFTSLQERSAARCGSVLTCGSCRIRILWPRSAVTGRDPKVAAYVASFPQTIEFLPADQLAAHLLPHYVEEGKSYLTIGFGCTGGQHRSVMMAEEMSRRLAESGYEVKAIHRDMPRDV